MRDKNSGFAGDAINWLRGVCMGAADIVPGVSGGTMALILGHYQRLVTAISRIDGKMLGMLRQGQVRQAVEYTDFRFLVALALGMASGIIALASLLTHLLETQLPYTYAVFTGLILASTVLVAQRIKRWSLSAVANLGLGAVLAWQLSLQQPLHGDLTPLTAFLCATVAICAMILPGISGAFVLLLLGIYHPITDLIKGLPKGDITLEGLIVMAAFVAGCLVGLLAFSRILKWLLQHYYDRTLAFLVGLMFGSLYKIWPFQRATSESAELPFKEQRFEHLWPSASLASVAGVVGCAMLAAAATLLLEWCGKRFAVEEAESSNP